MSRGRQAAEHCLWKGGRTACSSTHSSTHVPTALASNTRVVWGFDNQGGTARAQSAHKTTREAGLVSCRVLDTRPRAYSSWLFGNHLLTPLGCIRGHRTDFQLGNSNTFHVRAQQFSSCKSITISRQKVRINILKWVSLSFISICCKHNHRRMSENLYDDIWGRFLVITSLCKWQSSKNESKTQHGCLRAGLSLSTRGAACGDRGKRT